jgi:hypothetical protein
MNTKNKQNQKSQRRQKLGPKKGVQNPNVLPDNQKHHDQERPETRMTR